MVPRRVGFSHLCRILAAWSVVRDDDSADEVRRKTVDSPRSTKTVEKGAEFAETASTGVRCLRGMIG